MWKNQGGSVIAVQSKFEYQLIPISHLFVDKFTTIRCKTIGVQNDRMDEQVKQFYDVMMLITYQLDFVFVHGIKDMCFHIILICKKTTCKYSDKGI